MKAIFKREITNFFTTPIGYIFIGFFMLLSAILFVFSVLDSQIADLSYFFSYLSVVLVILVPVLTMRLLAEEKRTKTDQLLLTAPVTVTEIVMGKFLATFCIYAITLCCTVVYPIILMIFSKPVIGIMISQYVGFLLLGTAYIAIGLYISSLTENQVIAAVASFGVLLVLSLIGNFASSINNRIIQSVVSWISLTGRYDEFFYGILNPSALVYYISVTAVFIFLTVKVIDRRRYV